MAILVHAEVHGLAGRTEELRDLLRGHAERLGAAPGCLGAAPYESLAGEPAEFVLDAWWRDERALRAHYATEEYADYFQRIRSLISRPSDVTVHAIQRSYRPTGDATLDPTRQD